MKGDQDMLQNRIKLWVQEKALGCEGADEHIERYTSRLKDSKKKMEYGKTENAADLKVSH